MFEVRSFPTAIVLRVYAEMDFSSSETLEQTIVAAAAGTDPIVVVDLSDCDYLDSSCLAVLIRQHRALGSRLRLVVPPLARTRRIFEITGLLETLPIVGAVDASADASVLESMR